MERPLDGERRVVLDPYLVYVVADDSTPLDVPSPTASVDEVIPELARMMHRVNPSRGYWTFRFLVQCADEPRNHVPGIHSEKVKAARLMLDRGMLKRADALVTIEGHEVKVLELVEDHPDVRATLKD